MTGGQIHAQNQPNQGFETMSVPADGDPVLTGPVAMELLRQVVDPELHFNIVDLGLVYGVEAAPDRGVAVTMTLTSPGCPYGPVIIHEVREVLKAAGAAGVEVDVVWDPPWSPEKMSDEAKLELGFDV